eukprot:COSAG05_NODE_733_length_7644_cov_43.682704_7_plen_48_part_00
MVGRTDTFEYDLSNVSATRPSLLPVARELGSEFCLSFSVTHTALQML